MVFLIKEESGEKIRYHLDSEVIQKEKRNIDGISGEKPILNPFKFDLESNDGLETPMKYEIKNAKCGDYKLYVNSLAYKMISLGDICSMKENNKNQSYCWRDEDYFDFHGIEKALCGKEDTEKIIPKRILVIQME